MRSCTNDGGEERNRALRFSFTAARLTFVAAAAAGLSSGLGDGAEADTLGFLDNFSVAVAVAYNFVAVGFVDTEETTDDGFDGIDEATMAPGILAIVFFFWVRK